MGGTGKTKDGAEGSLKLWVGDKDKFKAGNELKRVVAGQTYKTMSVKNQLPGEIAHYSAYQGTMNDLKLKERYELFLCHVYFSGKGCHKAKEIEKQDAALKTPKEDEKKKDDKSKTSSSSTSSETDTKADKKDEKKGDDAIPGMLKVDPAPPEEKDKD